MPTGGKPLTLRLIYKLNTMNYCIVTYVDISLIKDYIMKKIISTLLVSTAIFASSSLFAYPIVNNVYFSCPAPNTLSSFGTYIAGFGSESILNQTISIYFQSTQYPSRVPDS